MNTRKKFLNLIYGKTKPYVASSNRRNKGKKVICLQTKQIFDSVPEAAEFFKTSTSKLRDYLNRRYSVESISGFILEYL